MKNQAVKRKKQSTWSRSGERKVQGTHVRPDKSTFDFACEFTDQLLLDGMSAKTIIAYCHHVKWFFLHAGIPPARAGESSLKEYVSGLFDTGKYMDSTIAIKIRSLKRFYGFLHRSGRILIDPSVSLREPVIRHRLPRKVMSEKDMEATRKSIKISSYYMRRNLAIIEVLYSTGLRLSELSSLNIPDVDLSERVVFVRKGKGGNDRCCVLGRHAVSALEIYLPGRGGMTRDPEALWISKYGTRLSSVMIHYILKWAAACAGVKSPSNAHAWRHGVATSLLRRGASIFEVQKFLGHASLNTTRIYTHLTVKDLKRIHAKTHPREWDPVPSDLPLCFNPDINRY